MKKGMVRIVFGYILVAFQVIGIYGNYISAGTLVPPHPESGYSIPYLIGYFMIGIIGLILLYFGYKARSES